MATCNRLLETLRVFFFAITLALALALAETLARVESLKTFPL